MEIFNDLNLDEKEIIGIYLLLKDNELKLDRAMQILFSKLEKQIQGKLTIEEFEKIKEIYEQKII